VDCDWDQLRKLLNMPYQPGSWFVLPERELHPPIALHKLGKRPVILGTTSSTRPNVRGCARTTSGKNGLVHPPHPTDDTHPLCQINKRGRIITRIPVHFSERFLNQECYSCPEPDANIVAAIVAVCG
jgi:hypothetical protein